MKNVFIFFALWLVSIPVYAWFGEPNRDERNAAMRAYCTGLLIAVIFYVVLSLGALFL